MDNVVRLAAQPSARTGAILALAGTRHRETGTAGAQATHVHWTVEDRQL